MTPMDIHAILKHLPHRYPMLLVDRVIDVTPGRQIHALKNVSVNEPFFTGHFPHHPVMPGVLILEALAQAAAILSFKTLGNKPDDQSVYYFVGIDAARFKRPVLPGDQLHLHVSMDGPVRRGIWKFKAEAKVDGVLTTTAELMCTVRTIEPAESAASAASAEPANPALPAKPADTANAADLPASAAAAAKPAGD